MDISCEYEISSSRYRCVVTKLEFNDTSVVRVFEKHPGQDVHELEIQDIHLGKFPRGIGKAFPFLKRLWIVNCGVKEIKRSDFNDLTNLKTLNMKRNLITELRDDVFDKLPGLVYLSLSHNFISIIDTKVFAALKNLDRLNLQSNTSVNRVWKDLTKLENFNNAMNQIEERCKPIPEHAKSEPKTPPRPIDEPEAKKMKFDLEPRGYLQPSIDENRSIYIGNISYTITTEDLRENFCRYGHIATVLIPKHYGEPKGYAFIEFESRDAVKRSLDMDDQYLMGRRIRVMRKRPANSDVKHEARRETRHDDYREERYK